MVIETELPPFLPWLAASWRGWLGVLLTLVILGTICSLFVTLLRYGPREALGRFFHGLRGVVADLIFISPRRIMALARLAVQESLHRWVLVTFVVFAVILLFAGWFLDRSSPDPARLYLSFVMTATSYLVLLLALFLSVFSLPTDITRRTIYTIVTKPVRSSEIIVGRVLGFVAVCTVMLAATGLVSYAFVVRGLDHTHELTEADLTADDSPGVEPGAKQGRTGAAQGHRHRVFLDADGNGETDTSHGHFHRVTAISDGDRVRYVVGPPQGMLSARVPVYGKLRFKDQAGEWAASGVNVGNEWTYRSYIAGGTLAAAVWNFQNISEAQFGDELPVEMNIRVFRTHKGDIERGILGSIVLRNPQTGLSSAPINFVAKEFNLDLHTIPRKLTEAGAEGREIDLYDDLVADGQLEIEISCLQRGQYFGMAQADLYLRANDASFTANFVKGYIGIWLQMVLLTAFGVMYSTFLNGSVAMLAAAATMLGGFFTNFMRDVATGQVLGGGPVEALYRTIQQANVTQELEEGWGRTAMEMVDNLFRELLRVVVQVVPDFAELSDVDYVANGYNIPADLVLIHVATTFAFLLPVLLVGHFFFKMREVAK